MEKILELLTTALGSLAGEDSELDLGSLFGSLGSDEEA